MRGSHHLKSWSATQKAITLSSAEAELAACVKMSVEVIGLLQLAESFGRQVGGEVYVDSSAALGVVSRKGNGKLRHIRVGQLWIQQAAEDEVLAYRKISGDRNPVDACTKHVNARILDMAIESAGLEIRGGRAEEGLEVRQLSTQWEHHPGARWADLNETED